MWPLLARVCLQSYGPLNVMGVPGAVGDPLTAFWNKQVGGTGAAVWPLVNRTLPTELFL